ncbi:uncharacterized protein LOC110275624 [Arachis duranensis]|uniref:Uncharacterized protein LOC110275624 n=1 Tax=Arachis duranensis TaxID=130453 RepID=A0A9C6TA89_ARADU|nr:uncharacterized protein LOC110275624 [Arachis duranensis]
MESPCTTTIRSNSSFSQPNLHSVDELFVDRILLPPLHLLPSKPDPPPNPEQNNDTEEKEKEKEKEKDKKKEIKKTCGGTDYATELNINIRSFSRSRSAKNVITCLKFLAGAPSSTQRVNSAPCSRSNSTGDSKSRKWPSSPGRPGVQVDRTSPVWQVRRTKNSNNTNAQNNDGAEAKKRESTTCQRRETKARVLNYLN